MSEVRSRQFTGLRDGCIINNLRDFLAVFWSVPCHRLTVAHFTAGAHDIIRHHAVASKVIKPQTIGIPAIIRAQFITDSLAALASSISFA